MMDKNQLVWRCRRGVRELDVLLGRFLESEYPNLSTAEKQAFERFLAEQDPIIMDWLFSKYSPEDLGVADIISRLQVISGL